jgi:Co/Zn/Cd efflux system component
MAIDKQMLLEIITDLILSILLAVGLVRSRTGWKQTDRLISRVLALMVETQVPPTLAQVTATLTLWLPDQHRLRHG